MISAALVQRVAAHLQAGGVVAYATESCYGLGCDPRDWRAVQRLLRAKGRPAGKGLILVAGRLEQLRTYLAPLSAAEEERLMQSWPGPVTFLLPASRRCPRWITGGRPKVAVRVSAHPDTAALCNALHMALTSTSANRSGARPVRSYHDCLRQFGRRALVLPGRVGRRRRPSTIVDFESGITIRA